MDHFNRNVSVLKTPLAAIIFAAIAGNASAVSNSAEYTVNGSIVTGTGTSSTAFFTGSANTGYDVTVQAGANFNSPNGVDQIQLDHGTVTVQSGATINYTGTADSVHFTNANGAGVLNNAGAISSGGSTATVLFQGDGTVNNSGTIAQSQVYGIRDSGSNLTVTNSGTIYEGFFGNAIAYDLASGTAPGTVTVHNTSTGLITSTIGGNCFGTGVQIGGGTVANITNEGTIHTDAGCGGGDIQISHFGSGSITNSGTLYVSSNGGTDDIASVNLDADTNFSFTNNQTGTITVVGGGQAYGVQVSDNSANISINNFGAINVTTTGAGAYGMYVDGTSNNVTITNTGSIQASGGSTVSSGIHTVAGSTNVTINNSGGTITGSNYGVYLGGSNSTLNTSAGSHIQGATDAIGLAGTNDTVSVHGQSHIAGVIEGNVSGHGTPLTGNTLNLYLTNLTPTQIAGLNTAIATAGTGLGSYTVGGDTYSWDSFARVNLSAISTLKPSVDSGLAGLAGRIDNLPSLLSSDFDSFYSAAARNPESALNSLSGRQFISGTSKMVLADNLAFGELADMRASDIHNDTVTSGGISTTGLGAGDELEHWSAWISESVTSANQSSTSESAGYHATINTPTVGVDYKATPDLTVGALARSRSIHARFDDSSSMDVDGGLLGAYATYSRNNWFANGLLGAGISKYSNSRAALNGDIASSDPSGKELIANISGGRDFKVDNWHLSPIAGLQYSHIGIDSYNEDGAGAMDLKVSNQNIDSLRGKVGLQASHKVEWSNITFTPNAQASWYHELLNGKHTVNESLSGAPGLGDFGVQSANQDKDFAVVGVGLEAKPASFNNDVSLFVNYNAQLAKDYSANTVYGGIKIGF